MRTVIVTGITVLTEIFIWIVTEIPATTRATEISQA
jgi:hypothetical protein